MIDANMNGIRIDDMVDQVYVGALKLRNGKTEEVTLKLGVHHWIDTDGRRWSVKDGKSSTGGAYPYLTLSTIVESPGATRHSMQKMTHTGRVRMLAPNKSGKGRVYKLRGTKLYWVDEFGRKFSKNYGWEVGDNPKHKVILDSIKPIEKPNYETFY